VARHVFSTCSRIGGCGSCCSRSFGIRASEVPKSDGVSGSSLAFLGNWRSFVDRRSATLWRTNYNSRAEMVLHPSEGLINLVATYPDRKGHGLLVATTDSANITAGTPALDAGCEPEREKVVLTFGPCVSVASESDASAMDPDFEEASLRRSQTVTRAFPFLVPASIQRRSSCP